MKIANVKGMVVKGMMVVLAAGALAMASPVKAQAEGFAVGVRFGGPVYVGPVYARPRAYAFDRHEEFVRHEEWVRAHRFRGYYR